MTDAHKKQAAMALAELDRLLMQMQRDGHPAGAVIQAIHDKSAAYAAQADGKRAVDALRGCE